MSTTRIPNPREVLALIPFQLGFVPDHSVVLVALDNSTDGAATVKRVTRIDLRPEAPSGIRRWVEDKSNHGDFSVAVIYSDDVRRAEDLPQMLSDHPRVRMVIVVTSNGWYDVDARKPDLYPLPDPATTQVGARLIFSGEDFAPNREAFFGQTDG